MGFCLAVTGIIHLQRIYIPIHTTAVVAMKERNAVNEGERSAAKDERLSHVMCCSPYLVILIIA